MKRKLAIKTVVAALFLMQLAPVAYASGPLTVSITPDYLYAESDTSFKLGAVTVQNAPSRVIADVQLTNLQNSLVASTDDYRLDVGTQCSFDNSLTGNYGTVKVSGDQSVEIMLEGVATDVTEALQNIWVYNASNGDCNQTALGANFAARRVQISMVESLPGLSWSPHTKHYYKLATQNFSDGMGQPTDPDGNITDSSRYFVTWATARSEARSSQINIGGNTHRGYLAAITTRSEFDFLNNNVSGGSGTLYPAWVGGTDQNHEGTWVWADGPEAAEFGGDNPGSTIADPFGATYTTNASGVYTMQTKWGPDYAINPLLAVDWDGNLVQTGLGAYVEINAYSLCGSPSIVDTFSDGNGLVTYPTGYGSNLVCTVTPQNGQWGFYYSVDEFHLEDGNGNQFTTSYSSIYGDQYFYVYNYASSNSWEMPTDNGYYLVSSSSMFYEQPDQFPGAQFWGDDSGGAVTSWGPDLCTGRGARGTCTITQTDATGTEVTNDYYVRWSPGNATHNAPWDGVNSTPGDGVYNPQPDNFNGNDPTGESALVINWCARNNGIRNSTAIEQTLYGNDGYRCTPGWNDLPANGWSRGAEFYEAGQGTDTPNQIGTTDYIIEYCGFDTESSCAAPTSAVVKQGFSTSFSITNGDTSALLVSFEAANAMQSTLSSATMAMEPFNCNFNGNSSLGKFSNFPAGLVIQSATVVGGAGGTGCFATAVDTTLTLNDAQKFLGFWWSAGNATNYVELLNEEGEVLARFTATDLVANLGSCPGNDYCGNPAMNHALNTELYAFVNLRFPDGFSKIRFYGAGFELDNITVSQTLPNRGSGETTVISSPVTTDCTGVTATQAQAHLVACPRTISIPVGSPTVLAPLVESQIASYNYGPNVHVVSAYVYTGSGEAVLLSNDELSLLANTVGQYQVDYAISDGTSTVTTRITINVVSNSVDIAAPSVILVDPRVTSVAVPALQLASGTDNTVCFVQVTDATGATEATPTFSVVQSNVDSVVALTGSAPSFSSSASNSDLQTALSTLKLQSNDASPLASANSRYLKVSAIAGLSAGEPICDGATWHVIEIRPLQLALTEIYSVALGH